MSPERLTTIGRAHIFVLHVQSGSLILSVESRHMYQTELQNHFQKKKTKKKNRIAKSVAKSI